MSKTVAGAQACKLLADMAISELHDLGIECEHEIIRRTGRTHDEWRSFMFKLWSAICEAEKLNPTSWRVPVMAQFKSMARDIARELPAEFRGHLEFVYLDGTENFDPWGSAK